MAARTFPPCSLLACPAKTPPRPRKQPQRAFLVNVRLAQAAPGSHSWESPFGLSLLLCRKTKPVTDPSIPYCKHCIVMGEALVETAEMVRELKLPACKRRGLLSPIALPASENLRWSEMRTCERMTCCLACEESLICTSAKQSATKVPGTRPLAWLIVMRTRHFPRPL